MTKIEPLISVIVTTKNEALNIRNCLQSIKSQTYKNIEIIVVDNYSNDDTINIAKEFTDRVYLKGPERSAQRNYAVSKSNGDYFLQMDADQCLSSLVIDECVSRLGNFQLRKSGNKENLALQIPETIVGGKGIFFKLRKFEKEFYIGTSIDCARFMPVNIFRRVGGYDEKITGVEDWDLDNKIREYCDVGVTNERMSHNEGHITLITFLRKKKYYLGNLDVFMEKWANHELTKERFGFTYRFLMVYMENGKWKKVFKNPLTFIGLIGMRSLVGSVFIIQKISMRMSKL